MRAKHPTADGFANAVSVGQSYTTSQAYSNLIDQWWRDDIEPLAVCEACGWSELLGDWPSLYPPGLVSGLVAHFAPTHASWMNLVEV